MLQRTLTSRAAELDVLEEDKNMEEVKSNTRLFANLSLGLFIAGLLVPFILAAIGGPGFGIGFGVVSELLALVFGILGWAHTRARVAVISIVVLFVLAVGMSALRWRAYAQALEEDRIEAEMQAQ